MKQVLFFLAFLCPAFLFAQINTADSMGVRTSIDTALAAADAVSIDSTHRITDSLTRGLDTISPKTVHLPADTYSPLLQRALQRSAFINPKQTSVSVSMQPRQRSATDLFFYTILALVFILAFLRHFYTRYFNNMFQVFFNTSLRQSQLTDQLLQAKQASLLFNVLFALSGGIYVFLLIRFFGKAEPVNEGYWMIACVLGLAGIYFLKYVSMKLTGWLTGNRQAARTYLFIIFLINKILGILLLPFVIVIAFGANFLQYPAIIVSMLLIALMFFLRFVRSYVLLQHQIKVSRFHFFMYILGAELLPLLLIYKGLMILLNKNL